MFNRKKKRIAELLRENARLYQDQKKDLARIHQLCEEADKRQADMDALAELHKEAGDLYTGLLEKHNKLKRDLNTEIRQKEELSDLLTKEKKQSGKLRQQLEKAKAQAKDAAGLQVEIEKLTADKEALNVRIENQAKTIADLQKGGDVQALKDKVLVEVAADLGCPDSCVHHANPGPGASICRNCIRNPRAVDKYEVAE